LLSAVVVAVKSVSPMALLNVMYSSNSPMDLKPCLSARSFRSPCGSMCQIGHVSSQSVSEPAEPTPEPVAEAWGR